MNSPSTEVDSYVLSHTSGKVFCVLSYPYFRPADNVRVRDAESTSLPRLRSHFAGISLSMVQSAFCVTIVVPPLHAVMISSVYSLTWLERLSFLLRLSISDDLQKLKCLVCTMDNISQKEKLIFFSIRSCPLLASRSVMIRSSRFMCSSLLIGRKNVHFNHF